MTRFPGAPRGSYVKPLFHIPFDRDYRLVPIEADNWTDEQFDAFYEGVAVGVQEVEARFNARVSKDRCDPPCHTLSGLDVAGSRGDNPIDGSETVEA